MFQVNGVCMIRKEKCIDCNRDFYISLEEFIQKTESRMKLPKRCSNCRRKRRGKADPYAGLFQPCVNIQQQKGTVIAFMAADKERQV